MREGEVMRAEEEKVWVIRDDKGTTSEDASPPCHPEISARGAISPYRMNV
jgi:hypothetical protein